MVMATGVAISWEAAGGEVAPSNRTRPLIRSPGRSAMTMRSTFLSPTDKDTSPHRVGCSGLGGSGDRPPGAAPPKLEPLPNCIMRVVPGWDGSTGKTTTLSTYEQGGTCENEKRPSV